MDVLPECYSHEVCTPAQTDCEIALTAFGELLPRELAMQLVDIAEARILSLPQIELPLTHTFTPGLYTRAIFIPAGTLASSKLHKTCHQYIISMGRIAIWDTLSQKATMFSHPDHGITQPGTRRICFALEDTVFTTIHAGNWATPEEVEADIIEPYINPYAKCLTI